MCEFTAVFSRVGSIIPQNFGTTAYLRNLETSGNRNPSTMPQTLLHSWCPWVKVHIYFMHFNKLMFSISFFTRCARFLLCEIDNVAHSPRFFKIHLNSLFPVQSLWLPHILATHKVWTDHLTIWSSSWTLAHMLTSCLKLNIMAMYYLSHTCILIYSLVLSWYIP